MMNPERPRPEATEHHRVFHKRLEVRRRHGIWKISLLLSDMLNWDWSGALRFDFNITFQRHGRQLEWMEEERQNAAPQERR